MIHKKMNWQLIIIVIILSIMSLITINDIIPQLNASCYANVCDNSFFVKKQAFGILFGIILVILILKIDLSFVKPIANFTYWVLFIMLFILVGHIPFISSFLTLNTNGASGWFSIPHVLTIQPVEFMKVVMLFKLAMISEDYINSYQNDVYLFKKYLFYGGIPILFVLLEPDLGGVILLLVPTIIMYLASCKSKNNVKKIIKIIVIVCIIFGVLMFFPWGQNLLVKYTPIHLYQLDRINSWLHPFQTDNGLQLQQSLILIGSAGLYGHGAGYMGVLLPEPHTDVIFSEFVGMYGYLLGVLLILMYCYIIINILNISKRTPKIKYKILLLGYGSLFFIQVLENIGMMLGIFPITGIVLPFMSYGVSALITYYIIIGIVLNINKNI